MNTHTEPDVVGSPGPGWTGAAADQDGSDQAPDITELFRQHHLALVRLALLIVGDRATAEDVVQDTFEQLHRRWHTLRRPASGLDYARSAVLNRCRSVLRHRGVARKHEPRLAMPGCPAADTAVVMEQRSELVEAFRALPRRQREVLALRYFLDLSVAETAATLRISEGTVRSTASRGLAMLASILPSAQGRAES